MWDCKNYEIQMNECINQSNISIHDKHCVQVIGFLPYRTSKTIMHQNSSSKQYLQQSVATYSYLKRGRGELK